MFTRFYFYETEGSAAEDVEENEMMNAVAVLLILIFHAAGLSVSDPWNRVTAGLISSRREDLEE
jgi:hypothetical protein